MASYEELRARHAADAMARIGEAAGRLEWSAADIAAERQRALRHLVAVAQERSPWHRRRLAGVDAARLTEADLAAIPPMTKDDLMASFDDIVTDSRWDMTYLGMQIMVEGLALAAFGFMHQMSTEPLLKQLLRYVMSDEARHVAFGVLSLKDYYAELTEAELFERQQFAFEAAVRMPHEAALPAEVDVAPAVARRESHDERVLACVDVEALHVGRQGAPVAVAHRNVEAAHDLRPAVADVPEVEPVELRRHPARAKLAEPGRRLVAAVQQPVAGAGLHRRR